MTRHISNKRGKIDKTNKKMVLTVRDLKSMFGVINGKIQDKVVLVLQLMYLQMKHNGENSFVWDDIGMVKFKTRKGDGLIEITLDKQLMKLICGEKVDTEFFKKIFG